MQLLLTIEELRMVARVLEKCLAQSQAAPRQREIANRLLGKVIERDLRLSADELEDLAGLLSTCRLDLKARIASEMDPSMKAALIEQRNVLEHASDKVTEACAMA